MTPSRAGKDRRTLKLFYALLAAVALSGIALIGAGIARSHRDAPALAPVDLGIKDNRELLERALGNSLGSPAAPVRLFVFSDYMCSWCSKFGLEVLPMLKREFADPGRVQVTYYDFPLGGSHVHSFLAARAARCAADQGRFWQYHELLLSRQQSWSYSESPPVGPLEGLAAEAGLEPKSFDRCLNSSAHAETVSANRELGVALGIQGTPTVLINGQVAQNPMDWAVLRREIEAALGSH